MNKDTEGTKHDVGVAQFRFALIAPIVRGLYSDLYKQLCSILWVSVKGGKPGILRYQNVHTPIFRAV